MNAADVIGRRITHVHQERHYNQSTSRMEWLLTSIKLDDGRTILFSVSEDQDNHGVTARVLRATPPSAVTEHCV